MAELFTIKFKLVFKMFRALQTLHNERNNNHHELALKSHRGYM